MINMDETVHTSPLTRGEMVKEMKMKRERVSSFYD